MPPLAPLISADEWQQRLAHVQARQAAKQQREEEHDALLRAIHEDLRQIRAMLAQRP